MIVAIIAVACAGTATAAVITGAQIKNGSVTSRDVKNNNLTTRDVKNRSLLRRDFKSGQLPRGATGPQGPAGPRGPAGANGTDGFGALVYPFDATTLTDGESITLFADCHAGTFPTGGDALAFDSVTGDVSNQVVVGQGFVFDPGPISWAADFNNTTQSDVDVFVDAACANANTVLFKGKQAKRFHHR